MCQSACMHVYAQVIRTIIIYQKINSHMLWCWLTYSVQFYSVDLPPFMFWWWYTITIFVPNKTITSPNHNFLLKISFFFNFTIMYDSVAIMYNHLMWGKHSHSLSSLKTIFLEFLIFSFWLLLAWWWWWWW